MSKKKIQLFLKHPKQTNKKEEKSIDTKTVLEQHCFETFEKNITTLQSKLSKTRDKTEIKKLTQDIEALITRHSQPLELLYDKQKSPSDKKESTDYVFDIVCKIFKYTLDNKNITSTLFFYDQKNSHQLYAYNNDKEMKSLLVKAKEKIIPLKTGPICSTSKLHFDLQTVLPSNKDVILAIQINDSQKNSNKSAGSTITSIKCLNNMSLKELNPECSLGTEIMLCKNFHIEITPYPPEDDVYLDFSTALAGEAHITPYL